VSSTGALSFGGDGQSGSMSEHAAWVLNGINVMTLGAQLGNLAAYLPTSCPTTEKQGWMGDALFAAEQSLYNFDLSAIYHSFLDSIEDNQGRRALRSVISPPLPSPSLSKVPMATCPS
jgi:hypothetical protein